MPRVVTCRLAKLCLSAGLLVITTFVLSGPPAGRPLFGFSVRPSPTTRNAREVRALWVVRTSLTSRSAIASMVTAARASGFNTLLVQIRGRGDAYYANGLEPRSSVLSSQPDF